MSLTFERAPTETPRIFYLSRGDVAAVGGDHFDLYLQTLHNALVAHGHGKVIQPLRAHGKKGHIADRIIAMPAHLTDPAISGIKWVGSKHDNPSRAGLASRVEEIACAAEVYTRARRPQTGIWLDLS